MKIINDLLIAVSDCGVQVVLPLYSVKECMLDVNYKPRAHEDFNSLPVAWDLNESGFNLPLQSGLKSMQLEVS